MRNRFSALSTAVAKGILVTRAHDPSDLWQVSRVLAGPDFLSVRRLFVPYSQPIRFARFDGKSVNRINGSGFLNLKKVLRSDKRYSKSYGIALWSC